MFFANGLLANTAAREQLLINGKNVKMQADTGADKTIIPSEIWKMMGQVLLDGASRNLEAYDGHVSHYIGSMKCEPEWKQFHFMHRQIAVVKSSKDYGLLGRDLLRDLNVNKVTNDTSLLTFETRQ